MLKKYYILTMTIRALPWSFSVYISNCSLEDMLKLHLFAYFFVYLSGKIQKTYLLLMLLPSYLKILRVWMKSPKVKCIMRLSSCHVFLLSDSLYTNFEIGMYHLLDHKTVCLMNKLVYKTILLWPDEVILDFTWIRIKFYKYTSTYTYYDISVIKLIIIQIYIFGGYYTLYCMISFNCFLKLTFYIKCIKNDNPPIYMTMFEYCITWLVIGQILVEEDF